MAAYEKSARETLRLFDPADDPATPPWAVFDQDWYRARYADAPDTDAAGLLEWHLVRGQSLGYSPNRYFDEEWQRQAWPGIRRLIESGAVASAFDAWCGGPHATRPAHWLFDPATYRSHYPSLTDAVLAGSGFVNLYHHYLRFGAPERRIGHALFDPAIYLAALDPNAAEAAAAMPFRHYLQGLENGAPERRTSLLFDPEWYGDQYPQAARAVEIGLYRCLLEHYLRNEHPARFDPSPWFSEEHYLRDNPGLAESIGPAGFRNGFAHFLAFGLPEGRSPHPALDLGWYAAHEDVRADIAARRAGDAFTHWIAIGHPAGSIGRPPVEVEIAEAHAVALYQRRADAIWPLFGQRKLDFSHAGAPAISVIMAPRDGCGDAIISLASLRAQFRGEIDLILIDADPARRDEDIENYVTGATVLRFGAALNDAAAREAGLICAVTDVVLMLSDTIELAPGAIDAALARLAGDPGIGAVGGRLVQPDGTMLQAGGIIWRDGRLQPYARGASPLAAEANFVRATDYCSTRFLLARRDALSSLPEQAADLAGSRHDAADLCVRIQEAGFRVVYDPGALAFLTRPAADEGPDKRAPFVAAHAGYLATRPEFDPDAEVRSRSPGQGQTRVLFVEDSVPLRRIGSGFVRSNDLVRVMASSGAAVTVFPMQPSQLPLPAIRAEMPDDVEVMHALTEADFDEFLAARHGCFDVIWIARTHNLDRIADALVRLTDADAASPAPPTPAALASPASLAGPAPLPDGPFDMEEALRQGAGGLEAAIDELVADLPPRPDPTATRDTPRPHPTGPKIIVDTEAVASIREAGRAALFSLPFDLDDALRQEFRHLDPSMDVIAVTETEAAIVRSHHRGKVAVLGHAIAATPTPRPFEERTGMLFVGAMHGTDHPNFDGLSWFIEVVLPLIERTLRWETRLTVAGYIAPDVKLDRFKGHPRVTSRGAVSNLVPLYDAHRVFIAPGRFAAGIPYKVHEAAAHGLPVVATTLLAEQLGWRDAQAIGAADANDPAGFAARVIALHRDATLWARMRDAALAHVAAELDPAPFASRVAALLRPRGSPDGADQPTRSGTGPAADA